MMETQGLLASPVIHRIGWNPAKMRNVLRSPIKSHGGKFYLSEAILSVCAPAMAVCNHWWEPCAGGANTSLQAEPRDGVTQLILEVDPLIANVWRVFTHRPLALALLETLQQVDVSAREPMENEWRAATQVCDGAALFFKTDPLGISDSFETLNDDARVSLAAATIVNSRMSRGGMGETFCWQDRDRGGQPGEINSWKTFVWNHAPRVIERCRNWFAFCGDANHIFGDNRPVGHRREIENVNAFAYFDPPYVKETRKVPDVYRADGFDHVRLCEILVEYASGGRGARVALSGYVNDLYESSLTAARGWTRHDFHIVNHSGQNKKKADRVESLWTNF
jgi:site-specific DNA-adenine methylase